MASISKRPNGRWRARYRDADRREHHQDFIRKADGERWLAQQVSDLSRGMWVDPRAGKITVRAYAESWRTAKLAAHRPSSAAHVETQLRRHLYPHLGHRQIASVKPSDVRAWVATISADLAPSTVSVVHGIAASVFKAAVGDGVIATSPFQRQSGKGYLPSQEHCQVQPLTTEQVQEVAAAAPERFRALILFAASTGLRQSEALGVTVDRLNLLRREVRVDRQLVQLPRQDASFGPPKTKASVRTVPLPQIAVDVMAAHLGAFPPGPDGLVFTDGAGRPLRRSVISAMWRRAAKAAGVADTETFHGLRHFYASLLIRHGESVKVVQSRLGHPTAAETLDTYSHLWPDSAEKTRAAIDAVFTSSAAPGGSRSLA